MIYNIYPKGLGDVIRETKLIPRKIKPMERLKNYHKYYIEYVSSFESIKVEDIEIINDTEYYFIRIGSKMHGCISYPISIGYELLHNKESIEDIDIINSSNSYSGAEIKYWFFINDIDFSDKQYDGFWPFVNPLSMNVIADNKYYYVINDKSKTQQFQMKIDREK